MDCQCGLRALGPRHGVPDNGVTGAGEAGSWGFLSSETFCKWRCRGGSGPWAAGQRSAAGQPAFGTKPKKEGKYRAALSLCRPGKVVPFSTQLGHLATPCDVTGQSRSHADRSGGPRSPSWSWVLLLPGILSSSFLPLVPQTTQQPRCTPTLSAQSHVGREETLQATRRPRRCAQAMCILAGRLDISVNEPAAMPLWDPTAFHLFNSNYQVQGNDFLLQMEERMENK